MACIHRKIRTKKQDKYSYCSHENIKRKIDFSECDHCENKEYKKYKVKEHIVQNTYKKQYKKHRRTKATSISAKVKKEVQKRDGGLCIICLYFRS